MKIVIWTQSAPKVEAIKEAINKSPYFNWDIVEIIDLKVSSEISDMPTSIEENMIWAKNRAINSKKEIYIFKDAKHVRAERMYKKEYWEYIDKFLEKYFK